MIPVSTWNDFSTFELVKDISSSLCGSSLTRGCAFNDIYFASFFCWARFNNGVEVIGDRSEEEDCFNYILHEFLADRPYFLG